MEHWKFSGDKFKAKECIKRAERELSIHRDLVRLGNLSQYKTTRNFGDGLIVECRTVFNDEIIHVYYNPVGGEDIITIEQKYPVPIIILNYNYNYTQVATQIFLDCVAPLERIPYPLGGTDNIETYKPYGFYGKFVHALSLRPIATEAIETFTEESVEEEENTQDPAPWTGGSAYTINYCNDFTFYYTGDADTGPVLVYPPDETYSYSYLYRVDYYDKHKFSNDVIVSEIPEGIVTHRYGESGTVTHSAITPYMTTPPYEYYEAEPYWRAFCDDEDHHTSEEVDIYTGNYVTVVTSAVVVGVDGYEDYKTWGVFYAVRDVNNMSVAEVYLGLYDEKTGYREYHVETANYLTEENGFYGAFLGCVGHIGIFDFYGSPYFVISYVGLIPGVGPQ